MVSAGLDESVSDGGVGRIVGDTQLDDHLGRRGTLSIGVCSSTIQGGIRR